MLETVGLKILNTSIDENIRKRPKQKEVMVNTCEEVHWHAG